MDLLLSKDLVLPKTIYINRHFHCLVLRVDGRDGISLHPQSRFP